MEATAPVLPNQFFGHRTEKKSKPRPFEKRSCEKTLFIDIGYFGFRKSLN